MRNPTVDDCVRLARDLPEKSLYHGEVGVIRSQWFAPALVFEVEFTIGLAEPVRALLDAEQIILDESMSSEAALSGRV